MNDARRELGDSHNFGREVEIVGKRVRKPRTVVWEWLLLSPRSPLRQLLGEPFSFLPRLKFFHPEAAHGAEVERLELAPLGRLTPIEQRALATIVGRAIALFSWLGVTDLHWENLVLGRDARAEIVLGPVDIEMILADFALPTETKLIPDADPEYADVCRHAAGVRRVLPFLGKPIGAASLLAIAEGYVHALALLDTNARAIADVFAALPHLDTTPIRVCLRGTGDYVAHDASTWPPLLHAELVQLDRGDIPYFFRLYGRKGIHYYDDQTLESLARIPLTGDVPKLDPILSIARGLRSPSRKKLREEGLLVLVSAFDDPSLDGVHATDAIRIELGRRTIRVDLPDGESTSSTRNLRAFVGSVYLPCTCGEVRSVFVAKSTTCRAPI